MRTSCSVAFTSLAFAIFASTQVLGYQDNMVAQAGTKFARTVAFQQTKSEPTDPVQTTTEAKPADDEGANRKVQFSFNEQDWDDVIKRFAKLANFALQPVDDYPDGAFTLLADDSEYTVLEALDQINHALRIRPEPYTLIRNRNMLVLWKLSDRENFPDDLIETVKVEDLDKRGKYETISCIFDMGELDAAVIGAQIEPLISRMDKEFFVVFPTANQIHIRETGGQLRKIRDIISASLDKEFGDMKLKVYDLQNLDTETFMVLARGLLGMPEGSNQREDEKLLISVEPFGERLFIRGSAQWLAEFDNVAKTIDVNPGDVVDGVALGPPYLHRYTVLVDPQLAFDTLQTMLESRDNVRMQQDALTGAVTVLGRKEDHNLVTETLAAISGDGGEGFSLIQLTNGDPAEIIIVLQNLFRQSADDVSGPVLLANSYTKQIIVRGTPQEVDTVEKMVAKLDASSLAVDAGPRTRTRIIPMGEREMEELAPLLPDLLMSAGRNNPFNMIMPEERKDIKGSIRSQQSGDSVDDFLRGLDLPAEKPDQSRRRYTPRQLKTSQLNQTINGLFSLTAFAAGINQPFATGLMTFQETDETAAPQVGMRYQPAPEVQSVPGAPVVGRFSNGSLILDSEDLDALDDLVYEIQNRIQDSSEVQRPTFFFLEHRPANEMISFLENFYGMSDGGGGGGGLVEGMVSNMMGGGDDILGDLLGGGTGGSSSGADLEGDVHFGVDMTFNSLYVRGATDKDLDEITILIDTLDQPEAPHDPRLLGEFRTIDIIHRDPMELKDLIEPLLGDMVDSGVPTGGGGGNNNEAAQMMKMVQQLSGGGKKGGGGAKMTTEQKPKVRLGVDLATSQLLVSGPEFIYKDILRMVIELDKPELSKPLSIEIMTNVNNQQMIVGALKQLFGPKIVEVGEGEAGSGISMDNTNTSNSANKATGQSQQNNAARSAVISEMIRSQATQQRAGGGGGARGGRGGGGNRGGGGGRGGR